jgi:tRNA pseudouridine38-40 synthase
LYTLMPTFKITVAYDGTDYVGWQRQANGVSIQALLEDALRALDDRDVTVAGAGRTDAGVHALGQVAAFTIARAIGADAVRRALNARLPAAVRVMAAEEVPATFHPRFGARAKTYRYRIWSGDVISPFEYRYAWHTAAALDVEAMQAAARIVEGRHDFAAFQAAGSDVATTTREIFRSRMADGRLPFDGGSRLDGSALLVYEVSGSGFLRYMVRTIVGTLVEIGRGKQPVSWMTAVLNSRERAAAGPTAPAAGLFLTAVVYADQRSDGPATLAAGP